MFARRPALYASLAAFSVAGIAYAWANSAPPPVYEGSTFTEVVRAINGPLASVAQPTGDIAEDLAAYGTPSQPKLPSYAISPLSLLNGVMSAAARRTVSEQADYRPYFQKQVHANGICMVGTWEITAPTPFTGYFAQGSQGLFVGRISAATDVTAYAPGKDGERSFGFAGKIFPTLDPNRRVRTANFFTVDSLTGLPTTRFADTQLTNEPFIDERNLSPVQWAGFKILQGIFASADPVETIRLTYPIARLGLAPGAQPQTPHWIKVRMARESASPSANDADFRDELSIRRYPQGFKLELLASNVTKDRLNENDWTRIGEIRSVSQTVSFGCDRRLHFAHPTMRDPDETPQHER